MSSDPPAVKHDFALDKLNYTSPTNQQKYWRINMYFNRKPGISSEYFTRHWHHVHADLVTRAKAFRENNILRYNQFYQSPEGRVKSKLLIYGPPMEWDACTEFWVKNVEDFVAFANSKEYIDSTPDIYNFVNVDTGIIISIGYDNLVYGEAVPGYGRDGVVRAEVAKL